MANPRHSPPTSTTAITARVAGLADTAIRHRPPWMSLLGEQPITTDRARQWRSHVEVITGHSESLECARIIAARVAAGPER